jgi:hypothetical protein
MPLYATVDSLPQTVQSCVAVRIVFKQALCIGKEGFD